MTAHTVAPHRIDDHFFIRVSFRQSVSIYSELTSYRRLANLVGGIHGDFEDLRSLLRQLADTRVISTKLLRGRLDVERSVAVQRTYVAAFFDLWLKNKDNHLLDGASADYPEIELYF